MITKYHEKDEEIEERGEERGEKRIEWRRRVRSTLDDGPWEVSVQFTSEIPKGLFVSS